MRIAVISDIHGNCFALDAVLADIRQQAVEQIVCLGDAIQGGALPVQTVQRLPDEQFHADPWADYAIITMQEGRIGVEFRHVPFDVDELVRLIQASGKSDAENAIKMYHHANTRQTS